MSFTYAILLPNEQLVNGKLSGPATEPANWIAWPLAMVPIAALGLFLALKIWNAYPKPKQNNTER
jgi:OPA family glycerol-3-phosphate transporter-like MFS transporter